MLTAFFSPTGTTRKVVLNLAAHLSVYTGHTEMESLDFTILSNRKPIVERQISRDDLFVLGIPVYAGRVPNVILPYLKRFKGDRTKAIIVAVYGNRHYDDSLMELRQLLSENGFIVIAAGAFIGEHAFSDTLASGRPDIEDLEVCKEFARQISNKLLKGESETVETLVVKEISGNWPLRPYYKPTDEAGVAFDFKRIVPVTNENCIGCGLCAKRCPMQSVSYTDHLTITGICIKCCACVKCCPTGAKQFKDQNFIKHKEELEHHFSTRRAPEFFL